MGDACRELVRLIEGSDIPEKLGIEDGDVGFCTDAQGPPVTEFQALRWKTGHAADRFREGKNFAA